MLSSDASYVIIVQTIDRKEFLNSENLLLDKM